MSESTPAASAEPEPASSPSPEPQGAVATAEPPAKPPAPPTTATKARPPRRRGCGTAAVVVLVLVGIAAASFGLFWMFVRPNQRANHTNAGMTPYESAMYRAGVKSPGQPINPVDLATVQPKGSHSFDATFTPDELATLANTFPHEVAVGNTPVSLRNIQMQAIKNALQIHATVAAGGSAYQGSATGNVSVVAGKFLSNGPITVEAEGQTLAGAQAQQAESLLLAYANGYLAAAPGLKVESAEITPVGNIHVVGTAPDSISWQP